MHKDKREEGVRERIWKREGGGWWVSEEGCTQWPGGYPGHTEVETLFPYLQDVLKVKVIYIIDIGISLSLSRDVRACVCVPVCVYICLYVHPSKKVSLPEGLMEFEMSHFFRHRCISWVGASM